MLLRTLVALLGLLPCLVAGHGDHGGRNHPQVALCDDAKTGVETDYMMPNKSQWTCQGPYMTVAKGQTAVVEDKCHRPDRNGHYCVGETFNYSTNPPFSGAHRAKWPVYGEYKYVPAPRYIHGLEHGGIVMLYHPCAPPTEVEKLKTVVGGCLRRHLITPYVDLSTPMALLSWGCILRLNRVGDESSIRAWIKKHVFKTGRESAFFQDGLYTYALKSVARVVSDNADTIVCPPAPVATPRVRTATPSPTTGPKQTTPSFSTTSKQTTPSSSATSKQTTPSLPTTSKRTTPSLPTTSKQTTPSPSTTSKRTTPNVRNTATFTAVVASTASQQQPSSATAVPRAMSASSSSSSSPAAASEQPGDGSVSLGATPSQRTGKTGFLGGVASTTSGNNATNASTVAPITTLDDDSMHNCSASIRHCLHKIALSKKVWAGVAMVLIALVVIAGLLCMQQKSPLSSCPSSCCCRRYAMLDEVVLFEQNRNGKYKQPLTQQFRQISTQFTGKLGKHKSSTAQYAQLVQEEDDDVV